MSKQKQPTCFDCIYAVITPGTVGNYLEPPDPAMAECKIILEIYNKVFDILYEIAEEKEWNEDELPKFCGMFKPKLIEKCGNKNCNKEINVPEWSWELWATTMWEYVPVCCEECKQEVEYQDELKQLQDEGYTVEYIKGESNNA